MAEYLMTETFMADYLSYGIRPVFKFKKNDNMGQTVSSQKVSAQKVSSHKVSKIDT